MADVVARHGRLRWSGHLKCRSVDDSLPAFTNVDLAGIKCRGRETWKECLNYDMELLGQ